MPKTLTAASALRVKWACGKSYTAPGSSSSTDAACMPAVIASGSMRVVARLR